MASVGEVPKLSDEPLVYTFEFSNNRRAIIDHQTWGFIKMWTTRDEPKRFFAVQLVHEAAAEIIEYYSMIIALSKCTNARGRRYSSHACRVDVRLIGFPDHCHLDIPLRDICRLSFAHPTYSESVKQACDYVLGQSTSSEGTYLN